MQADFVKTLTAQSTLSEVPSHGIALEIEAKGQELGDVLERDPSLPGVVVVEKGTVRGAISRGQYLRQIGRYLGQEVYHPRPIRLLFEATETMEEPLILDSDTPIQAAVQQALTRPRGLVYEPVILRGVDSAGQSQMRLIDFQDLLRADSRISELRNQQMKQILDSVQEGFLLVDSEHRIAAEYSRSIESIFAMNAIAGQRFPDVLSRFLPKERAELGGEYLDTLFNPEVIEKLVVKINPLLQVETRAEPSGNSRHLAFRFKRSLSDGEIRRILVKVEDRTREVALARELEAQERQARQRVDLVFDLMRADPGEVRGFIDKFDQTLGQGRKLLAANGDGPPMAQRLAWLSRAVHGLKGEASLLGLKRHQQGLHHFEDQVTEWQEAADLGPEDLGRLKTGIESLGTLSEDTRAMIAQFQRLGRSASAVASASQAAPSQTASSQTVQPPPAASGERAVPTRVQNKAPQQPQPQPPTFFQSIARWVQELAEQAGRSARFYTQVTEDQIPRRYFEVVRTALVQLVRNSIVHGIEPPEVRQERGKPLVGTLQFALKRHPQSRQLELIFQDDGQGLDLERIRRKALARGLEVAREDQLPLLIFHPGFSTAESTTQDAGRGVGMDLVKAQIEKLGGYIVPHSRPGVFCAFQMVLPLEDS